MAFDPSVCRHRESPETPEGSQGHESGIDGEVDPALSQPDDRRQPGSGVGVGVEEVVATDVRGREGEALRSRELDAILASREPGEDVAELLMRELGADHVAVTVEQGDGHAPHGRLVAVLQAVRISVQPHRPADEPRGSCWRPASTVTSSSCGSSVMLLVRPVAGSTSESASSEPRSGAVNLKPLGGQTRTV